MEGESPILMYLVLIPLAGSIVGAFVSDHTAKAWALVVSLATFLVSLAAAMSFVYGPAAQQLLVNGRAIPSIGFSLSLGVNSISLWLMILTTLLAPLAIAASFESIKERKKEYYAWMQLLLAAMIGVFISRDLLLFYAFFELTLIPMFFIIGIWGGPDRRYAAGKFFLFTFTGSVFTLAVAIFLGLHYGTFDIDTLISSARFGGQLPDGTLVPALTDGERQWVLLGFLAGFAVKVPLFPVHTWLPLAHTEAPTAGSVILAGVLLKLGTYGLLRLAVPLGLLNASGVAFPALLHAIGWLCIVGIIYGALVAWVQQDMKKLVAYSSVSHLGFCVLGLVALNPQGIIGSVLYMINHGLSTGAMFLCVGMVYDRYHTRDMKLLSGLVKRMPILAFFWILFTLSSIGLPGLNGFVSEFLTILGAFISPFLGITFGSFAALGIILGAVYMLHLSARVIWGPLKTPEAHDEHGHGHEQPGDIGKREIAILVPLALAVVFMGVYPGFVMRSMSNAVDDLRLPVKAITDGSIAPGVVEGAAAPAVAMDR
ncbi:MAG TPA: NADH-quinone oxidoreductase subunit M [Tepidisphaeraceae bacterium]|nr:NADH-quinone oxidoreductase subunit M [Tepidisphaeraceae bacterium]